MICDAQTKSFNYFNVITSGLSSF